MHALLRLVKKNLFRVAFNRPLSTNGTFLLSQTPFSKTRWSDLKRLDQVLRSTSLSTRKEPINQSRDPLAFKDGKFSSL